MNPDTVALRKPRPERPCMPLFFSLAGWALLHAWLLRLDANHRAHLAVAALGLVVSAWPAARARSGRLARAAQPGGPAGESPGPAVAAALLLLAGGAALGALVALGSVVLLGAGAVALMLVPWARLPLSRHRPALSCAVLACGFSPVVLNRYQAVDVMFLPLAAWVFWLCACLALIPRARAAAAIRPAFCDS